MRELGRLLSEMLKAGVFRNCALFGAAAQMRYTGPVTTLDADVPVAVASEDRLAPLLAYFCSTVTLMILPVKALSPCL